MRILSTAVPAGIDSTDTIGDSESRRRRRHPPITAHMGGYGITTSGSYEHDECDGYAYHRVSLVVSGPRIRWMCEAFGPCRRVFGVPLHMIERCRSEVGSSGEIRSREIRSVEARSREIRSREIRFREVSVREIEAR